MRILIFVAAFLIAGSHAVYARTALTSPKTCYVNIETGSSSNDGLTPATAKALGQQCVDLIANEWDRAGHDATIQYANGQVDTYGLLLQDMVGDGYLIIESEACLGRSEISVVGNESRAMEGHLHEMAAISTWGAVSKIRVRNIKLSNSGWGFGIIVNGPGWLEIGDGVAGGDSCVEFGPAGDAHIDAAASGAIVFIRGDYWVTGGSQYHHIAGMNGYIMNDKQPHTVHIRNNPNFSNAWAVAWQNSSLYYVNLTYDGWASGKKWIAGMFGTIFTGGACHLIPGTVDGVNSATGICQ